MMGRYPVFLFVLLLPWLLLFIGAQKVILTTPTTGQPEILLVSDSTVYYSINDYVFITYYYADASGKWSNVTTRSSLPETPLTGTIYQGYALFAGNKKLAIVQANGSVSSADLPLGSSPLLCTVSVAGQPAAYLVQWNSSDSVLTNLVMVTSTTAKFNTSAVRISREQIVALVCGSDMAVAGSENGNYVMMTWTPNLNVTPHTGSHEKPYQGAYVLPNTYLFSVYSTKSIHSKYLFDTTKMALQSNTAVTASAGVTALASNPTYAKFYVGTSNGIYYSDYLNGCVSECQFNALASINLNPSMLASDDDMPFLFAATGNSVTLIDPVTLSVPLLQSPSTAVKITAGTPTTFTYQLFDDLRALRLFVQQSDSPVVKLHLSNGSNINVSPTFSYSVNKTYSFTYTPTLPGTIGLFFGGSLDSNFTVVPGSPVDVSLTRPGVVQSGATYSFPITVLDKFLNVVPQAMNGLQATTDLTFDSSPLLTYQISIISQSTAQVTINETKSGSYAFTVFLRGDPLQRFTVQISPGVLFLKQDSLIFSPSTATAGQPFSIIIQAKDQNDNIISSTPQSQLNISFSPPGYVSGGCSSSSGRINCTYSFNVSRLYIVTIQTVNMPATSLTPQTIDVLHSTPYSMAVTPAIISSGNVSVRYTTKLIASDVYGNIIGQSDGLPGQSTNFMVLADSINLQITMTSDATGTTLQYNTTVAAKYVLSIYFCPSTCPNTPTQNTTISFVPGTISTTKSSVVYPPTSSLQVATQYSVVVSLRDDYSNAIVDFTGLVARFSSSNITANQVPSTTLNITFHSTASGSYTLDLTSYSGSLLGSPYRFTINPGPANFTTSLVSYDYQKPLIVEGLLTVSITTLDTYLNTAPQEVNGWASTYNISIFISPSVTNSTIVYDTSTNTTRFTFTTTTSGSYRVATYIYGRPKDSRTWYFQSGTPMCSATNVIIPKTTVAGQNNTMSFISHDKFGNIIDGSPLDVGYSVSFSSTDQSTTSNSCFSNGTCMWYFNMTKATDYVLHLSCNGVDKNVTYEYPFTVNAAPTANYNLVPLPYGDYYVGVNYSLLVTAYDQFTNVVPQDIAALTTTDFAFSYSAKSLLNFSISDLSNGSVRASFYTIKAQSLNIYVFFPLLQSFIYSPNVTVLPGQVDCSQSVVLPASLPNITVSATPDASFSITSYDVYGNDMYTNPYTYYSSISFTPAGPQSSNLQDGPIIRYNYSTKVAADYSLLIKCSSLNPRSWTLPFTALPMPAASASISVIPSSVYVGQMYTLVATARDIYNNTVPQSIQRDPFSTSDFSVVLQPAMDFFQLTPLTNKSLAIAFNTTVARQYNITVSFAGQVLLDQTITVNPGQIVCGNTRISPSLNGSLNVGEASTSLISSADIYGNPIYTNPLDAYKITFSSSQITFTTTDLKNGIIELEYITNVTGGYTSLITCSGADSRTWFYNLTADPGYPVLATSKMNPPSFPNFTVDDTFTFILSANDLYDNPVTQAQGKYIGLSSKNFRISFGEDQDVKYSLSALEDSLQVTIWSHQAATYDVTISLMTDLNRWSNFFTASFVVSPGPASIATSQVVFYPSTGVGVVGTEYSLYITAVDQYGNSILLSPQNSFEVSFSAPSFINHTEPFLNGTFMVTYRNDVAGNYTVSVMTGGMPLRNSLFSLALNPDSPTVLSSKMFPNVSSLPPLAVDDDYTFTLTAFDRFGNIVPQYYPLLGATPSFQLIFSSGDVTSNVTITEMSVRVHLTTTVSKRYSLTINLLTNNSWTPFRLFSFSISPGVASSTRSVVSYPPAIGEAGVSYTIQINAFDKYNNIVNSPVQYFELKFAPSDNVSVSIVNSRLGTFRYNFTTPVSDDYTITLSTAGKNLPLFPYQMVILPGIPTKSNSIIPAPVNGTAGSNYSLDIVGRDRFNNLVPQSLSPLSLNSSSHFVVSFSNDVSFLLSTNSAGHLSVTYWTTAAAQNDSMIIMLNNALAYQFFFTIKPAVIAAERCLAFGDVLTAGGLVTYDTSFLIVSRDKFDNVITESTANFTVVITGPTGNLSISLIDLRDGTYQVTFRPIVAALYQISVTLSGVNIIGSPFNPAFISVPASLAPLYGPMEGGTDVTISGTGFYNSKAILCKFEDITVPGMFTNNSIVCKSPALSPESTSSDIIDVKVAIAMDGVHFSADVLTFKYYTSPSVSSIAPRSSPFSGGTIINITGQGFQNLPSITCRFGPLITVPAVFSSPTLLFCVTPEIATPIGLRKRALLPFNTSQLDLEVSLNNQQFTTSQSQFIFYTPPVLQSVTPPYGPLTGNTTISLKLDYIPICNDFSVKWGTTDLNITCIKNQSTINFMAPAQADAGVGMAVDAQFSVDRQHWIVSPKRFSYTQPISTFTSCPSSVGNNNATIVAVFGASYIDSPWTSCSIKLNGTLHILNATVVSDKLVSCFIPPGLPTGETIIQISNNNQNFEGGVNFTLFGAPSYIRIVTPNGNFSMSDSINRVPLLPAPEVQLLDYSGVPLKKTSSGSLPSITVATRLTNSNGSWDAVSAELGGSAQLDPDSGIAKFDSLKIVGDRGSSYDLRFEYPNLPPNVSTVSVMIHPCKETEVLQGQPGNLECLCNAGYFLHIDKCEPCLRGTFMPETGQKYCIQCPGPTTTAKEGATNISQCICAENYFTPSSNTTICDSCPPGALCPGGTSIQSKNGFWQAPDTYTFYACPEPSSCVNQSCAPGSSGPVCGACSAGYALVGYKCTACPRNHGLVWFLFIITGSAILVGISLLIYNNVNGERSERTIVLKILINYLQTLSFLGGFDYIWTYSKAVLGIFQFSSASNISVGIFTVYCAVQWDQYQKFLLYMFIPVVGGLIVVALFFLRYLKESAENRSNPLLFTQSAQWKKTKSTVLVFLFLIHPTLTEQIFKIFSCERFGNARYLAADLSISCDDARYRRWQAAAIAMIVIYVIGIPACGFSFVFHYRHHLGDPSVKQRFRFLYEGYAKHAYFWEFVIILRKVVLVAIVVFLKSQSFRSVFSGLWLLLTALLIHIWVSPYQEPSLEVLESFTLCILLATLLFGLFSFADNYSPSEKLFSTVVVLGLNILMSAVLVVILVYLYYNMISKNTRINMLLAKIKRFLDSKRGRQGDYEPHQEELDDFGTDSVYSMRISDEVTADRLRGARRGHHLDIERHNSVNLSRVLVGASPSRSSTTSQTTTTSTGDGGDL